MYFIASSPRQSARDASSNREKNEKIQQNEQVSKNEQRKASNTRGLRSLIPDLADTRRPLRGLPIHRRSAPV